jgi:4-amino-4-deoxy-L-arabinose transferase-like glycosyltransferase
VKTLWREHGMFACLAVLLSSFYLAGVAGVPFHPDETSWLFQSRDLEALLTRPLELAWEPGSPPTEEMTYRALNAPLAKYLLGFGRRAAGFQPSSVQVDWNWSQTWAENERRGALPGLRLLLAARFASAALFPFSLGLLYWSGLRLHNRWTGVAAVLLFGTNALVLLHTRRAMAEGALSFAMTLAIVGMLAGDRRPWLAGLGFALALWSKQSAGVLFPAACLSVVWSKSGMLPIRRAGFNLLVFLMVAVCVSWMLNPFLWRSPLRAAGAMLEARQAFVEQQRRTLEALQPGIVLGRPGLRLAVLLDELFIAPPQLAESGNYAAETGSAAQAYLSNPWNHLLRGLVGGSLLALTLVGVGLAVWRIPGTDLAHRRDLGLVLLAMLLQAAGLWLAVPLPYQRYALPLVPFTCLWAAYAATAPPGLRRSAATAAVQHGEQPAMSA